MPAKNSFNFDVNLVAGKTQGVDEVFQLATNAARGYDDALKQLYSKYGTTETKIVTRWETDKTGFDVPVQEMKQVNVEADKLVQQIKNANRAQKESVTSLQGQIRYWAQARDSVAKYNTTVIASGKAVRVVTDEWRKANAQLEEAKKKLYAVKDVKLGNFINVSQVGRAFDTISQFGSKLAGLAGIWGVAIQGAVQFGMAIAGPIMERTKQVQGLTLSLQEYGVSQEDVNKVIDNSKKIALTYGVSLETVEKGWKRIGPAVLASGGTMGETEKVITGISARMVALGLNSDQSGRYVEAFAQVMGKGKLQSEELNQQFAELDGSMRPMLASFVQSKYGINDLEEAMKNGQITAKIFREFMIDLSSGAVDRLAGSMTNLTERIYDPFSPATLQQIEGFKTALNTISVDSLSKVFAGVGQEINAIGLYFSQFFANLNTQFPALSTVIGGLATILGGGLRIVVVAVGNAFLLLLKIIESVVWAVGELIKWIGKIPGVTPAVQALGAGLQWAFNKFQDLAGVDPGALQKFSDSGNQAANAMLNAGNKVDELNVAFKNGRISQDQYKAGLNAVATEAVTAGAKQDDVQKLIVTGINKQIKAIDIKKKEEKSAYETRKLQLDSERTEIEKVKTATLARLDAEKQGYDDLKAKILDRYAKEDEQQMKLGVEAKKYQLESLNLEQDKINAKITSGELDAQQIADAKAQILNNKARALQLEKEIKTTAAIYDIDKKIKVNAEQKKDAEAAFNAKLKDNSEQLKDNELKYKNTVKALDDQKKALETQVTYFNNLSTASDTVKKNIAATASEIANMKEGKIEINIGQPLKSKGGYVSGGQKYTVNELGQEMFLTASGLLRSIKTPSWGTWRAPSAGYVIPADITRQLRGANNPMVGMVNSPAAKNTQSPLSLLQTNNQQSNGLIEQVGKLTQAVNRMNSKDWKLDVRIDGKNASLLDQLNNHR